MPERDVTVVNTFGIHARPASKIAQLANRFEAAIEIRHGDTVADAKSVLGLLTLAAPHGSRVHLRAEGPDAEPALDALAGLFDRSFDEEG